MNEVLEKLNAEDGAEVRPLYDYGVGIDTHRDFIQVCVLVKAGNAIMMYESEHLTTWKGLVGAGKWIIDTIGEESIPTIKPEPLRYTIESTSTYHLPVIKAIKGKPCVVNPVLAGSTKKKTDVLDARLLSYQSLTGLWPESFVIPPEIEEFRLLMRQRHYHCRECTAISNRINNYILRFGHTLGSYKSVRSIENRAVIEDMCGEGYVYKDNYPGMEAGLFVCPDGLPAEVKKIIKNMFTEYDAHDENVKHYQKLAMQAAKKISWETDSGYVQGDKLIENLMTVPSVGELTALVWLSEILTPLRFNTAAQLAAYCGCDPSLKVSAGKVTSQTKRNGNAKLHFQLSKVAGSCINRHCEPFGRWGYAISKKHARGGYKKASGAVARRIAVSLYFVHKQNAPFSYDNYNFYKIDVPYVHLGDMGFAKRLENILLSNGLTDSKAITDSYIVGNIHDLKGMGKKSVQVIDNWIQSNKNKNYKSIGAKNNDKKGM
jgi:transposase